MKILILGADGYIGWPATLAMSDLGYDVLAVDNLSKKRIASECEIRPLNETLDFRDKAEKWLELSGKNISTIVGDLTDPIFVNTIFSEYSNTVGVPDAPFDVILHLAEQPSAPYSMRSVDTSAYTLSNNLLIMNSVLFSIKVHCPQTHLIHIGTMGEYGTPNIDIEEGWLDVEHNGRHQKVLYPRQASSIYHTSKIMTTDLIWFAVRTWGLRCTDLMQGPVYGYKTEQTKLDDILSPSLYYDEFFGTLINRFAVQAALEHPLTVYGKGEQTRGYINIQDTINCLKLTASAPPEPGELKIFNQITETFSVNQLAKQFVNVATQLDLKVDISHVPNPRVEAEEHYYNPTYSGLKELGLTPNILDNKVIIDLINFATRFIRSVDRETIFNGVKW
jgi:UDP-sulfoquinovose synthase